MLTVEATFTSQPGTNGSLIVDETVMFFTPQVPSKLTSAYKTALAPVSSRTLSQKSSRTLILDEEREAAQYIPTTPKLHNAEEKFPLYLGVT